MRHGKVERMKRLASILSLALALIVSRSSRADQMTNGHVNLTLPDSGVYEGDIKDGLLNGKGVLHYRNGFRIEGEFKDGLLNGTGVFLDSNGYRYEGDFKDGRFNGNGVCVYANEDRYEGEWKNGSHNGEGHFLSRTGTKYDGQFKDGHLTGTGVLWYADGTKQEGVFRNGELEGTGIVSFSNGVQYEGEFRKGKAKGSGVYIMSDGTRYAGAFKSQSDVTFEPRTSSILAVLLTVSLILNFVLLALGGHARNLYKTRLEEKQSASGSDNLDDTEPFEKIVVLDNEAQAEALDFLLAERGVPHEMRSYHDSALDGVYQSSQGWGHVEAPKDRANDVLQALKDLSGPPADSDSA